MGVWRLPPVSALVPAYSGLLRMRNSCSYPSPGPLVGLSLVARLYTKGPLAKHHAAIMWSQIAHPKEEAITCYRYRVRQFRSAPHPYGFAGVSGDQKLYINGQVEIVV